MKILWIAHPSFLEHPFRREDLSWLRDERQELLHQGCEVEFFDALKHKLGHFDIVHLFSDQDVEEWSFLAAHVSCLVMTPGLSREPKKPRALPRGLSHDQRLASVVENFLVFDSRWKNRLMERWGVKENKIRHLENRNAFFGFYQSLLKC